MKRKMEECPTCEGSGIFAVAQAGFSEVKCSRCHGSGKVLESDAAYIAQLEARVIELEREVVGAPV